MARIERNLEVVFRVSKYGSLSEGARLKIVLEPGKQRVLGREKKHAHIIVKDEKLSRAHIAFYIENNVVYVEDLKTKNGTEVNGVDIAGRSSLQVGDRLRVGKHVLELTSLERILQNAEITSMISYKKMRNETSIGRIVSGYGV